MNGKEEIFRRSHAASFSSRRVDIGCGLAVTLFIAGLHLVLMQHAGGLWRDEVNTVHLSTPGMTNLTEFNGNDSFPILWFLILRGFIASGLGGGDPGLRLLGLVVGLAILGSLWLTSFKLGRFVPMLSLVLFAFNAENIRWGDSMRAHGLGTILLLLTLWLMWQVVCEPSFRNWFLAAIVSVFSVQCAFYNSFLLLAMAVAGIVVAARQGQWKKAVVVWAAGVPAALSLLPYVPMIMRMHEWDALVRVPFTFSLLWQKLDEVLGAPGLFMIGVWRFVLLMAGAVAVMIQFRRFSRNIPQQKRDLALYCLVTMIAGVLAYIVFLYRLSYPTEPWYYIALTALLALCADGVLSSLEVFTTFRHLRLVLVALALVLGFSSNLRSLQFRQTTVDLIAEKLNTEAAQGDLIVVAPWNLGVSFGRYYKGEAEWETVPPVKFHTYHRYFEVKPMMFNRHAMLPLLSRMGETLRGGHRIWLIGTTRLDGQQPLNLPPPPLEPYGWNLGVYDEDWARQAGFFLSSHTTNRMALEIREQAQGYENPRAVLLSGWRD